jgi:hypothetical protein
MNLLRFLRKGWLALSISFFVGLVAFFYFLFKLGPGAIRQILANSNLFYIALFILFSFFYFLFSTLKSKIILNSYNKDVPFFMLMKQVIAGYAVSYITPSARVGGEPVRVYMLKKENNINMRTGSAVVLIDKFVELTGIVLFAIISLFFFIFSPEISRAAKIITGSFLFAVLLFLTIFYLRTISRRGSFSSAFNMLQLTKIKSIKHFFNFFREVEKKMGSFFIYHKHTFFNCFLLYFAWLFLNIIQMKFLLLGLGVDASLRVLIVSLAFLGIAELLPIPAALGTLEAGQFAVFSIFLGQGSLGFAVSLFLRADNFLFVALGFAFLSHFGWGEVEKLLKKVFKNSGKNGKGLNL